MSRIFGVLAISLAFGAFLAWPLFAWPVRPGWIGAAVLLLVAVGVRRHWDARGRRAGDDPGARERQSWHAVAALGVLSGHLIVALAQQVDLHVGRGNTLALDNWTLLAAAALGWLIVRAPRMVKDERDREIAARGAHVGHATLTGLLVVLLLTLGFAPPPVVDQLQPFVLGNVLVVLILLATLAKHATQLAGYWAARPGDDADG
ncbi:MAG: hypothetical protein KKE52_09065 [Alphaproteobacteria bacterium]|nr:hypothetical protein [Alphaproteobacteria bacterium]MBU2271434.1 hypothetical protein [Alphaproteobacteria bacterium]MBU2398759.1 hypothetical protein [Alphaproteobacteria bacterium]